VENFSLFSRLMDDPRYVGRLAGDISALTETSRVGPILKYIIKKTEWHGRLLNGSDYPLPGYIPEISIARHVDQNFITPAQGRLLVEIRQYDPLLFDFLLKRQISVDGARFAAAVFETADFFAKGKSRT